MSQETTQAKFRKAPKKENDKPQIEENEVRIKGNMGNVKVYVGYACGLLQGIDPKDDKKDETGDDNDDNNESDKKKDENSDDKDKDKEPKKIFKTIVLKATGRAINKAVTTAEVVKRRIAGLHQDTKLETLEIVDVWEPTEEGLQKVETTRRVASITIKLSLDEAEILKMKKSSGYQPPLSADSVKSGDFPVRTRGSSSRGTRRGRGRGGFRGRGNRNFGGRGGYNRSYRGRGRGRGYGYYGGRGRGFGGGYRGRGGYNRNRAY